MHRNDWKPWTELMLIQPSLELNDTPRPEPQPPSLCLLDRALLLLADVLASVSWSGWLCMKRDKDLAVNKAEKEKYVS